MAYTSQYPVTVDGVRLDTLAWGVELKKVTVPGVREASEVVPGVDGVIPALAEDYEPGVYALDMMVRGSNEDGVIPADSVGEFRKNLDHLLALFSTRHRLLDVREVVDASGTVRQASMKRLDAITPEVEVGALARFTVTLSIPGVFWRDLNPLDWVGAAGSSTLQTPATLAGATAPIQDAIFLVKGPIANPTIRDSMTGWELRLNRSLTASEFWRVNSGTWSTRVGSSLTLASTDTAGTDVTAVTEANTPSGRFLALTPVYLGGGSAPANRMVVVSLTGTGTSTATQLSIRARKAFL